jgi:hypothetical protein
MDDRKRLTKPESKQASMVESVRIWKFDQCDTVSVNIIADNFYVYTLDSLKGQKLLERVAQLCHEAMETKEAVQ